MLGRQVFFNVCRGTMKMNSSTAKCRPSLKTFIQTFLSIFQKRKRHCDGVPEQGILGVSEQGTQGTPPQMEHEGVNEKRRTDVRQLHVFARGEKNHKKRFLNICL